METLSMRTERREPECEGVSVATALTFLLVGVGAGALLGMMYAPKTGKQFRKEMRSRLDDAKDTFDDWKDQAMEVAEEAIDRGSEIADDLRERVAPIAKNLRRR
jgi:gas vesicle protein